MPDRTPSQSLHGRHILVAEDEYLMASELCRRLQEEGADVIGPAPTVEAALALARADGSLDGAVLDVNLQGGVVFPVVEELRRRGVPVVFATGYDAWALPAEFGDIPRCEKPVEMAQLMPLLQTRGDTSSTAPPS